MSGPYRDDRPTGRAAPPSRCLYCASIVPEAPGAARACPVCGVAYAVTGEKHVGAPCPRCPGESLRGAPFGGATLYACSRCRGCFVHALDWDELLAEVDEGERRPLGSLVPPPPGQGLTERERFAALRCPVCAKGTERFEFAGHRGLWLDACPAHGLWLDAGELVAAVQRHEAHPGAIDFEVKRMPADPGDAPGLLPGYESVAADDPHAAARYAAEAAVDGLKAVLECAWALIPTSDDDTWP